MSMLLKTSLLQETGRSKLLSIMKSFCFGLHQWPNSKLYISDFITSKLIHLQLPSNLMACCQFKSDLMTVLWLYLQSSYILRRSECMFSVIRRWLLIEQLFHRKKQQCLTVEAWRWSDIASGFLYCRASQI